MRFSQNYNRQIFKKKFSFKKIKTKNILKKKAMNLKKNNF